MEFLPGTTDETERNGSAKADSKSFIDEESRAEESLLSAPGKTGAEVGEPTSALDDKVDDKSRDDADEGVAAEGDAGVVDKEADKEEEAEVDEWMDILGSGHLKKRVLKGEKDWRPQKSDVLKVKYVGRLEETGKIVDEVEEAEINLGDNEVIHGLDFALSLMDKGEEAEVIVKSRFAFGDMGREPDVPSGATLVYTITLLDINPEPLIATINLNDRLTIGLRKKERGNWWYTRDEYTLAINCYRRALEYFDDTEFPSPPSEDELKLLLDERLKTYNNLGASQIKIQGYDAALISFGHVLAAQPNNVKALFRKSTILKEKGELQEAISVMQKALSIEPDNRRLQNDLQNLLAAQRRDNTKQRDLYKKMMGTSTDADKKKTSPKSSSRNAVRWLVFASTFVVAMASFVAVRYAKM
uniref:peptidylprolyl isomerase n=1 Tax=Lygus hesperus TaxID=30085 RepID=A0A0K8TJ23_LYGHE